MLKEAGQRVEEDEPILQIETDKVTVDVRAPSAGVVEAILVSPALLVASSRFVSRCACEGCLQSGSNRLAHQWE